MALPIIEKLAAILTERGMAPLVAAANVLEYSLPLMGCNRNIVVCYDSDLAACFVTVNPDIDITGRGAALEFANNVNRVHDPSLRGKVFITEDGVVLYGFNFWLPEDDMFLQPMVTAMLDAVTGDLNLLYMKRLPCCEFHTAEGNA